MADWSVREALEWARGLLEKDVSSPGLDAELLLCHTTHLRRVDLYIDSERMLTPEERDDFMAYVFRRKRGEPVAYITGEKEFYGLSFEVGPGVLIPRPETELLVEKTLEVTPQNSTILELGTGSGAVIISVLVCRPDLNGRATDISSDALVIAKRNALRHNVQQRLSFAAADVFDGIEGKFPVIVMNPPYVSENDISQLSNDIIKYEPACALFGGADGLDVIRRVMERIDSFLIEGGIFIMETGYNQKENVEAICAKNNGLKITQWLNDLAGRPRVVVVEKAGN